MSAESKVAAPVGGVLKVLADYSRQHGDPDDFIAARATVEAMAGAAQKALDEMYAAEPTAERFTAFQDAWDELRVSLARYYGRTES